MNSKPKKMLNKCLLASLSVLVLLSGCALSSKQAKNMSSMQLCEMAYFERPKKDSLEVILTELNNRKFQCEPYFPVIAQTRAQREAMAWGLIGMSLQLQAQQQQNYWNQMNYQNMINPAPTRCRVIRNPYGDQVICH